MNIEIKNGSNLSECDRSELLARPDKDKEDLTARVAEIISMVRNKGDEALFNLASVYDSFCESNLELPIAYIDDAENHLDNELKTAIDDAYERIRKFHLSAKPEDTVRETAAGVSCEYRYRGYERVGVYIPGGSAPLISTVLMTGVPAQIAGVNNIQLCSPVARFEQMNKGILYAAKKCGINSIYCIGGAQAIAALAYGTQSIPRVQKIFGPGNAWVTEAKQQVAFDPQGASIDMPAGPSEVLIIADNSANAVFTAMDLLSQLEHGADSQAVLISDSHSFIQTVAKELESALVSLNRKEILAASMKNVLLIRTNTLDEAISLSNQYAPEHLLLQVKLARDYLDRIRNAGSVFIGKWTPESLGDYCSGTNHVLPTYGFARSYNGLSVMDFMQRMTIQEATELGIQTIGPCAMTLAEAEGLDAHKRAVELRLQDLKS